MGISKGCSNGGLDAGKSIYGIELCVMPSLVSTKRRNGDEIGSNVHD